MQRLLQIIGRYGWRTPFVVISIAFTRLQYIRNVIYVIYLRLITKGTKKATIFAGHHIHITAGCELHLGQGVYIGDRCVFEISINPLAKVTIRDNTWISHDCHITSQCEISIGENVLIGEFVSIRDSTHQYSDVSIPIKQQPDIIGSIVIEDDVWIGRGTLVLGRPEGVVIGKGSIIAANSSVSSSISPHSIVGGNPAKLIKFRNSNYYETSI